VIISVYQPLLCALVLCALAPSAARRLPPAIAARALVLSAGVIAAGTIWAAGLLVAVRVFEIPVIAHDGHLLSSHIVARDPVPALVSEIAAVALLGLAIAVAGVALQRRRALGRLRALADSCDGAGDLVVLPVRQPIAVALPGANGRVIVSAGLLQRLDAPGRAVLLAHERSHLTHRHDRLQTLAALAAAVNPLLRPVRREICLTLERWADEDAAHSVADRARVASTLARVALLDHRVSPITGALAFHEHDVAYRIRALGDAPRQPRPALLTTCLLPCLACALAVTDATGALLRIVLAAHV